MQSWESVRWGFNFDSSTHQLDDNRPHNQLFFFFTIFSFFSNVADNTFPPRGWVPGWSESEVDDGWCHHDHYSLSSPSLEKAEYSVTSAQLVIASLGNI